MIPDFLDDPNLLWPILPPGIWDADMSEIEARFVVNERRAFLFKGLKEGLINLFKAGCPQIFLDGSYVTDKPSPNDYEVCWDTNFVDPDLLDPIFLVFDNEREKQKERYLGEYFPALLIEGNSGKPFLDFFQIDKHSGKQKGIIRLKNFLNTGGANDN